MPTTTIVDVPLRSPVVVPRSRNDERQFYVRMGYVCALVAIGGFIPTYWAPVASQTFSGAPIHHVHGLLFSAWPVLFVTQARLAAGGRFEHHRALGFAGISLATAMFFTGVGVVMHSLAVGASGGYGPQVRAFAIVPLSIVVSFGVLVAGAIANVRRPDVHMRLMLAASITILPPAVARLLFLLLAPEGMAAPGQGAPPSVAFSLLPSFLVNSLLIIAMIHDWRKRGGVHSAYVTAGVFLVAVQIARIPFSTSTTWHAITSWLLRIGG